MLDAEHEWLRGRVQLVHMTEGDDEARLARAYTSQLGAALPPREMRWAISDKDLFDKRQRTKPMAHR